MKISRAIATIIMFVFLSIISIFLSANLHFLFENQTIYPTPKNISDTFILISFVFKSKARLFFIIFEVLIAVFLTYVLCLQKINGLNTYTRKVTPDIETPTAAGKGEYGTARWLEKNNFKYNFGYSKLPSISKINRLISPKEKWISKITCFINLKDKRKGEKFNE